MDNNSQFNPIVVVKGTDKKPPFFKRIQAPFSKLSLPNNKKYAGAIVALLLVFGVGLGAFLVQRQTQLTPRASENGVDLKIEPTAVNTNVNQEFSVDVILDAKQASASAAQVKVTFDAQKLELVNTTIGSFMPVVLQQPTPSAGAVEFVVGTSTPRGGSGSIATLRFKALVDLTTSTITMDPANTIVTVVNMNDNQAGDITPSTVTVGAVSASPSSGTISPAAGFNPDTTSSLKNNLIAYWKMDETSGANVQDWVGGYNATATANATVIDGKISKGRNIGAQSSYLSVTPIEAFSTDTMTVSGWVKPTSFGAGNFATIFNYRPTANNAGMTLEYAGYDNGYGQGQIQCQVFVENAQGQLIGAGMQSPVGSKLTAGQWNHVACSYDGTTAKMYINGAQVQTGQAVGKLKRVANMKIEMGRNIVSNESLNGGLDEIGYWGRALTQQEITNLYNGGQGNTYSLETTGTPETSLKINAVSSVSVGQEFNVPIYARSDIENSNVFAAKINFPADLLEVVSVNDDSSFITSWVEQFYDNQTGQISLVGGVPNPGYKSNNSDVVMAIVRFKAKAAGTALLDMTSQSQIFSNATNQNILQKTQDVSFPISGSGTASPSPVSCQSDSQCSTGYYCQSTSGVCQDMPGGQCTIAGQCLPNSSKPSPSIAPEVSPSPSAGASASPNCATLKGDGNADCTVNLTDLSIMLSNFSATNPVPAGKQLLDFNNDNRINTFDFSSMADKLFQLGVIKRRS